MSTATLTSSASTNGLSYGQNVGRAARALLAALLAVSPRSPAAQASSKAVPENREASILHLYRLAASYDSVMPNLAQELRAIASRN